VQQFQALQQKDYSVACRGAIWEPLLGSACASPADVRLPLVRPAILQHSNIGTVLVRPSDSDAPISTTRLPVLDQWICAP